MKKIFDFLKSNILLVRWTLGYFAFLAIILKFLFKFNVFSACHWWKFFHATLHGFGGLVFGAIMYSAIPIYIASALIIYRKKTAIITLPFSDKIKSLFEKIKTLLTPTTTTTPEPEKAPEQTTQEDTATEYPADMPRELYIPYMRAKQNMHLNMTTSTFNQPAQKQSEPESNEPQNESFPIPSDFDISDSLAPSTPQPTNDFPVFKDLDFDTPLESKTNDKLSNSVTKYFDANGTEYEIYQNFVATKKYVIYDHGDEDFWIMDDDTWFASKKQIKSPISDLLDLAKQNDLTPVLYLESQNIMDLTGTVEKFKSAGIRVVKKLEELD